jgi:glycosyltransferase involved in cell wall biosynthesis
MSQFKEDLTVGDDLFQAGKLVEAKVFFERIVQADPHNHEAMNNLGSILYKQGDILSAECFFKKSFSLKDDDGDVLLNLADLYIHQKNWEQAAYFLDRYLCFYPADIENLNKLALIFMESGNHRCALDTLGKSLELKADQEDIRNIVDTLKSSSSTQTVVNMNRRATPRISVCLFVFNGGNLLPQAIESILMQDFCDIELIISDNCSTDQTQEVCLHYQQQDRRIKYYRLDQNLGMLTNLLNALGHADAKYCMFATHDDLREKTLISSCLPILENDPSVALVYPRSKIFDADLRFIGFGEDCLNAAQESPKERFKHVIWEFTLGNAFLGIFRLSVLKKITSWGKTLFGDNLLLAEVALHGKIIQIDKPLFIRRLTRNYDYNSYDERNTQLMSDGDPHLLSEGISFPHVRLAYAHLELLNQYYTDSDDKEILMKELFKCFRTRFGPKMAYEIDRAIALINSGHFYYRWDQKGPVKDTFCGNEMQVSFHISSLLKRLHEALFFFPDRDDLARAYGDCWDKLNMLYFSNTCVG